MYTLFNFFFFSFLPMCLFYISISSLYSSSSLPYPSYSLLFSFSLSLSLINYFFYHLLPFMYVFTSPPYPCHTQLPYTYSVSSKQPPSSQHLISHFLPGHPCISASTTNFCSYLRLLYHRQSVSPSVSFLPLCYHQYHHTNPTYSTTVNT